MQSHQQTLAQFLTKNNPNLSPKVDPKNIKATILQEDQIEIAANNIRDGKLVAFPTETVYGLGANPFNEEALKMIYQTKKRPLTDPIIVHVWDWQMGEELVVMSDKESKLFRILAGKYWPGPLTIILKANLDKLPLMVTAQTGFVGIRSPLHPYARNLIKTAKLPIGAPSANLFSHVSPTQPLHVFNDFFDCDISIVNGGRCEYGVQSTVVKIVEGGAGIEVLREGSLEVSRMGQYLKAEMGEESPQLIVSRRVAKKNVNMESPGQLLKHYAPYLPCYYYQQPYISNPTFLSPSNQHYNIANTAFISFSQTYEPYSKQAKYYFQIGKTLQKEDLKQTPLEQQQDKFCPKQEKMKMRQIYYLLRKCQNLEVEAIVVGWGGKMEGTLWDKVMRATQNSEVMTVPNKQQ